MGALLLNWTLYKEEFSVCRKISTVPTGSIGNAYEMVCITRNLFNLAVKSITQPCERQKSPLKMENKCCGTGKYPIFSGGSSWIHRPIGVVGLPKPDFPDHEILLVSAEYQHKLEICLSWKILLVPSDSGLYRFHYI